MDAAALEEKKRLKEEEKKIQAEKLAAVQGTLSNMNSALDQAAEHSVGLAIAQKAIANAEAIVNTYKAANVALASAPPPFNYALMASVVAAGLANVVKINTTPIPSAETGGSFIAKGPPGVDSNLVRVNNNERVDVTPAGQSGQGGAQDYRESSYGMESYEAFFFRMVNKGIRSGEIILAGNI